MAKNRLATVTCAICGKQGKVHIENGIIKSDWAFFGKFRFGIGAWSSSKAAENPDGTLKHDKNGMIVWERCHPRWKELWFHLVDLKRLLFHQYHDVEYWECPKCFNKVK